MIRKTLSIFAIASLFVATACKENAADKVNEENLATSAIVNEYPKLEVENTTHDFGDLTDGEKAEHVFIVKNTGKADLLLIDAKASCGCTAPNFTKTPIKPGETGEVNVVYTASGNGIQQKTVTLTTNTESGSEVLTIKANVNPKK